MYIYANIQRIRLLEYLYFDNFTHAGSILQFSGHFPIIDLIFKNMESLVTHTGDQEGICSVTKRKHSFVS